MLKGVTVQIKSLKAGQLLSLSLPGLAFLILGMTVPAKSDPVTAAYLYAESKDEESIQALPGGSVSSSTDSLYLERATRNGSRQAKNLRIQPFPSRDRLYTRWC